MTLTPFVVPVAAPGIELQVAENGLETTVHCSGKITAENAEAFRKQICGLVPASRGHVSAITRRITLDMARISHVDSFGLDALRRARAAAEQRDCLLDIGNRSPQVEQILKLDPQLWKIVAIAKPRTVLARLKESFRRAKAA